VKNVQGIKSSKEVAFPASRFTVASLLAAAVMAVLIGRIYLLQVIRGDIYRAKSESNFIQERRIAHNRGAMLDQTGRVLVDNRPSHDVYMTLAFLPDSAHGVRIIRDAIGLSSEEASALDKSLLAAVDLPDDRIMVRDHIDADRCAALEQAVTKSDIDGVVVVYDPLDAARGCLVLARARAFPSRAAVFRRLRDLLGLAPDEMADYVEKAGKKARGLGRFKPTLLIEDTGFDGYARVEAEVALGRLPGIDVVDSKRRRYRHGVFAPHLLGFTNELSAIELEAKKADGYRLGDRVGRRGIEAAFEKTLRGQDGIQRVVVDAKGRRRETPWAASLLGDDAREDPVSGHDLVLTIDERMQRTAETSFLGLAGSVVAIDAKTGFVLALASFPTFDPNDVTGARGGKAWAKLIQDPLRPLTFKAIQDHYAPGSTWKAVTAIAGLREKLITPSTVKMCPGSFRLGRAMWRCYARGGHGPIALLKALQASCDTYFYSLGYELGPDRLADTARLLGFGAPTGIGIDREIPGIVPDRAYYVRHHGAYTPGLVVNTGIGQGDLAVTPLQLAVAYAAIVNGGSVMRPQVVSEVREANGALVLRHDPVEVRHVDLDPAVLTAVKDSLSHVMEGGGTAAGLMWRRDMPELSKWLRESGIRIGGKTGTAQVVRLSKDVDHVKPEDVPYEQRDNAWFVGFAPVENPEIIVVTMTEHGGFGGSMSAPVTAAVMKTFFEEVRPRFVPKPPPMKPPAPRALPGAGIVDEDVARPPAVHDHDGEASHVEP
jgi:penicillin-binding protein 2